MIVFHAGVAEEVFLLWGEKAPETTPRRKGGRGPRKTPPPRPFPFEADYDALSQALDAAATGVRARNARQRKIHAWLPTLAGQPLPSSPIVCEFPESRSEPILAPFLTEALALTSADAVLLLCGCAGKKMLAPGVGVGNDLAFWTDALHFAGALVARQQFLPCIERRNGSYRACWTPVFAGDDAKRLAALAAEMPAVARALGPVEVVSAPETAAADVLRSFLAQTIDHLIRASIEAAGASSAQTKRAGRAASASAYIEFRTVHDEWLHALRAHEDDPLTPNGLMGQSDAAQIVEFAEQTRQWRRPVYLASASPFRLCFRLEEPVGDARETAAHEAANGDLAEKRAPDCEESKDKWMARFLLQSVDDPSLIIDVEDAWKPRGQVAQLFKRSNFNTQEYLLSSLGQAAGICPNIESSLRASRRPAGYELDAADAHEFLTEKAMALEQAGFGVMLPAWWSRRRGTKHHLSAQARVRSSAPTLDSSGMGKLALDQIVSFNWEVALGGDTLSESELETLANLKAPLVKMRGQWVELNAEEIRRALTFWRERGSSGEMTVRQAIHMALGASDKHEEGIEFEGVSADGWMGELLQRLESPATVLEPLDPPQDLEGELRPYQQRGYSWLAYLRKWGLGACLADDMGLGKTIQTLALILRDWNAGERRPTLVICPTSVVNNWKKEALRFTPTLPVMVHHGTQRKKGADFVKEVERHAIVLTSYGLLTRDLKTLKMARWAGLALDEAQNVKNPSTKQSRAARSIEAEYRVALTGTPVENHVGDLWSIMEILNPSLLGSQAEFRRRFLIPIQASHDPETARRLRRLTGPFILRRLKSDKAIADDLPEKQEMKVYCNLTREQASLYAAVLKETDRALKGRGADAGIQRKGVILATLSKLKQVCNHPAHFLGDNSAVAGRSGKLARLTEMLEEVAEVGERALVFTQFVQMGHILQNHIQETFGHEALFLHGGVAKGKRDRMIDHFQSPAGPPVFILSIKAGGAGLNLTNANHVFHYDRWWNPAVENQATDRAHRIGQTRDVQVHKYICAGTMEEKIDELIESKVRVAGEAVGTGEGWITELSNQALRDVFALREEAVGD